MHLLPVIPLHHVFIAYECNLCGNICNAFTCKLATKLLCPDFDTHVVTEYAYGRKGLRISSSPSNIESTLRATCRTSDHERAFSESPPIDRGLPYTTPNVI